MQRQSTSHLASSAWWPLVCAHTCCPRPVRTRVRAHHACTHTHSQRRQPILPLLLGRPPNPTPQGDMLKPAAINTPWARAAAVMAAVALAAGSTVVMPARLGAFLHVSAYGTYGWAAAMMMPDASLLCLAALRLPSVCRGRWHDTAGWARRMPRVARVPAPADVPLQPRPDPA